MRNLILPVLLFHLDENQELSEHTSPFDVLIQFMDGELKIKLTGKINTYSKWDSIIMPANAPHVLKAIKSIKVHYYLIHD